ncbi:MAG: hypothetical protein ACP5T9_05275 [Thermoplasmata archaeon]
MRFGIWKEEQKQKIPVVINGNIYIEFSNGQISLSTLFLKLSRKRVKNLLYFLYQQEVYNSMLEKNVMQMLEREIFSVIKDLKKSHRAGDAIALSVDTENLKKSYNAFGPVVLKGLFLAILFNEQTELKKEEGVIYDRI